MAVSYVPYRDIRQRQFYGDQSSIYRWCVNKHLLLSSSAFILPTHWFIEKINNNRIKFYTGKSNRCFSKEPDKYSTLININDENIKKDSNLEQGMIRGNYTSFSFRHKKSPRFNSKAFIYMAPPDGLEPPT